MIKYILSVRQQHNLEEYPSLAEGIGLENRQAGQTARGFESLFLLHLFINIYASEAWKTSIN